MHAYFVLMARYNLWANEKLFAALGQLKSEQLTQNVSGLPFSSALGTANHLFVADSLWMARFMEVDGPDWGLDHVPYPDLSDLQVERNALDIKIFAYMVDHDFRTFLENLIYKNTSGERFIQSRMEVYGHFFNHQTHHRSQIATALRHITGMAPDLDLSTCTREVDKAF